MAISKFNAEQFAHMNQNSAGIIFVYAGKEGKNTAVHFFGSEFEATAKTQDEILRVVRNCLLEQWQAKAKEFSLKEDNNGIATKFRASTPAEIIINSAKNERIRRYDTSASSFAKFGFVPTKKDVERLKTTSSQKTHILKAAVATLEALNFRTEFPRSEEAPATETAPAAVVEMTPKGKKAIEIAA